MTDDLLQMCRYIEKRIMKALSLAYLLSPETAIRGEGVENVKIKNISFTVLLFQISKPSRFLPQLSS